MVALLIRIEICASDEYLDPHDLTGVVQQQAPEPQQRQP